MVIEKMVNYPLLPFLPFILFPMLYVFCSMYYSTLNGYL